MTRIEKQAWWQSHIEDWELSGQSQSNYCERHSLKLTTFSYWRTRFLRQRLADEAEPAGSGTFVAVNPSPTGSVVGNREAQASIDYGSVRIVSVHELVTRDEVATSFQLLEWEAVP